MFWKVQIPSSSINLRGICNVKSNRVHWAYIFQTHIAQFVKGETLFLKNKFQKFLQSSNLIGIFNTDATAVTFFSDMDGMC